MTFALRVCVRLYANRSRSLPALADGANIAQMREDLRTLRSRSNGLDGKVAIFERSNRYTIRRAKTETGYFGDANPCAALFGADHLAHLGSQASVTIGQFRYADLI